MERKRSRTWATLLIAERFVWVLRDHFGRHCETEQVLDDGRARVRVGAPQPRDIARTLAGWGAAVQVLDPPAVRAELARIGAELTGRYGPPEHALSATAPPAPSTADSRRSGESEQQRRRRPEPGRADQDVGAVHRLIDGARHDRHRAVP